MLASIAWGQQVMRVKSVCINSTGHQSQSSKFQQKYFFANNFWTKNAREPVQTASAFFRRDSSRPVVAKPEGEWSKILPALRSWGPIFEPVYEAL